MNSVLIDWLYRLRAGGNHVLKGEVLALPWWKADESASLQAMLPSRPTEAGLWDARIAHQCGLTPEEFGHLLESFPVAMREDRTFKAVRTNAFTSVGCRGEEVLH